MELKIKAEIGIDELLSRWHDNCVCLTTRTIFMPSVDGEKDGEITADVTEKVIKNIHFLDSLSPEGDQPITILMNTPGGSWESGIGLYDTIKESKNDIRIIVLGRSFSMGSVIIQAADRRILSPNSKMMIHYGTDGYSGPSKIFEKWAEESKRLNLKMEEIYLTRILQKNPNFSIQKLKEMLTHDTILSAERAKRLGLCDEILGEETKNIKGDKNVSSRRSRTNQNKNGNRTGKSNKSSNRNKTSSKKRKRAVDGSSESN